MKDSQKELLNFSEYISREVADVAVKSGKGVFLEDAFTEWSTDLLSDSGESGNTRVCRSLRKNKAGNRIWQMNAYGLWDGLETLDIFVTAYKNYDEESGSEGQLYILDKNRMLTHLNLAEQYLAFAMKGDYSGLEDSAGEMEFLANFGEYRAGINRIRIILLTNGLVRSEAPESRLKGSALTVIKEVWDLERLYQLWSSGKKREPIVANLLKDYGQKIRVLTIDADTSGYTAYVAVVPGSLLADLYDVYGSRLLEQNVRVYLQNKGKVNKEIRRTILESPSMFMAYNNGISATATGITFLNDPTSGKRFIEKVIGMQIVNGGQTTSSIYYVWKKDRKPIDKVWLQMKITLIKDESKTDQLVSRISRYANSQNKVTETDLTSNQRFHIIMEELSRTIWAPSLPGSSVLTRWYYERSKGQYREDLNRESSVSRQKHFKEKSPSEQVIRKEELSKYRNAWNELPYWVVRGSQKNYLQFTENEKDVEPTRQYFKETVGMAILFKTAEALYGKKPYAMGDLRYIVVPYALAWLHHRTSGNIDMEKIWAAQSVPEDLKSILHILLKKVNSWFLNNKPSQYALVGEWAKREESWNALKKDLKQDDELNLTKIKKFLVKKNGISAEMQAEAHRVEEISVSKWAEIEQSKGLDPFQLSVVRNILLRLKKGRPMGIRLMEQATEILDQYEHQDG